MLAAMEEALKRDVIALIAAGVDEEEQSWAARSWYREGLGNSRKFERSVW